MNKGKKFLAVLSTAAMLASVAPAAGLAGVNAAYAAGSGSITATSVPSINTTVSGTPTLGVVQFTVPDGSLQTTANDNYVTFSLPSGLTLNKVSGNYDLGGQVYAAAGATGTNALTAVTNGNYVYVNDASKINSSNVNTYLPTTKVNALSDKEIQVYLPSGVTQNDDLKFYLVLGNTTASGLNEGPVQLTVSAPSDSVFPSGTVTIANSASNGSVNLAATDTQSGSNTFDFTLHVNEALAGSLKNSSDGLKIKLPQGYEWNNGTGSTGALASTLGDITAVYGNVANANVTLLDDSDTLKIWAANPSTSQAISFNLGLKFKVSDDTLVKNGDVVATVSGNDNTNVNQLTVGTYGTYGATIAANSSVPTLIAGQDDQQITDLTIKEAIAHSLIDGRTVELTLPSGARWQDEYTGGSSSTAFDGTETDKNGVNANTGSVSYSGSDNRTLKLTISNTQGSTSTDAGEIDLKNIKVAVAPDFSGDLNVQVGGSEGLTGTVKVATVQPSVTVSSSSTPNIVIGQGAQALGTITITENVAGAFQNGNNNQVKLSLPTDVVWDTTPTVSVTSGDLTIDQSSITTNNSDLTFNVKSESSTPSTITLTGGSVKVYRDVPYGSVALKVKGTSVAQTAALVSGGDNQDWNNNDGTAAKTTVANVVTPAPTDTTSKVVFTIGQSSYTANGQTQTAVVAPFIKDSRTFVGVRDAANALGVSASNIVWNNADRSVTIFDGNRVVRLVIGSNVLTVNGTNVTMDTAPTIVNDRTVLPVAWVGQALGVSAQWDASTQTVTFGN